MWPNKSQWFILVKSLTVDVENAPALGLLSSVVLVGEVDVGGQPALRDVEQQGAELSLTLQRNHAGEGAAHVLARLICDGTFTETQNNTLNMRHTVLKLQTLHPICPNPFFNLKHRMVVTNPHPETRPLQRRKQ